MCNWAGLARNAWFRKGRARHELNRRRTGESDAHL